MTLPECGYWSRARLRHWKNNDNEELEFVVRVKSDRVDTGGLAAYRMNGTLERRRNL